MNVLNPWKENLKKFTQETIGTTQKTLLNNRKAESDLGNFVTDSMVHWVSILSLKITLCTLQIIAVKVQVLPMVLFQVYFDCPFDTIFGVFTLDCCHSGVVASETTVQWEMEHR